MNNELDFKNGVEIKSIRVLKKGFIRSEQHIINAFCTFIHYKQPKLINSYERVAVIYSKRKLKKVLIVADPFFAKGKALNPLYEALKKANIEYVLFTEVVPNPTFECIYKGRDAYKANNCDSLIAVGGGSVMDTTKLIGVTITNSKPIEKYKGIFKVKHNIPILTAIPTTCGTGSETTLAAVVRDEKKNLKYPIESNRIVPDFALLDVELIRNLPKSLFASTAMDAMTHAIESYLNSASTVTSRKQSIKALQLLKEYIIPGYNGDVDARKHVLLASFLAGKAFNRGMVGNVHAIAHALGGEYNLPHGFLNAVILPIVLKTYFSASFNKLDNLSREMGIGHEFDKRQNALCLIRFIDSLNETFGFPKGIKEIEEQDIPKLAHQAFKEAVPLYSTPVIYSEKDFMTMLYYIKSLSENN